MTLEELNVKITAQNEQFKKQIDEVNNKLSGMQDKSNQVSKTLSSMFNLQLLNAGVRILTNAYNAFNKMSAGYFDKIEQETKLAEVMRERMNATDSQINAIKKLTEAEQALGVIEDDVLMAGLQQLGTFSKYPSTLESLNGAMANLIAQQKGYDATAQDAITIGNLMGKVLQGQTSALTRVGITFTEAQEEVLKYGNEQERAAMLAEVITDNVGNMNAALLKTPRGQLKQLQMNLDDIGDSLTEGILAPLMAAMPMINSIVSKGQAAAKYFSALMQGLFGDINTDEVTGAIKENEDLANSVEKVNDAYQEGTSSIDEFNVASGFSDEVSSPEIELPKDDIESDAEDIADSIRESVQPVVDFIKENKDNIFAIVQAIGLMISPLTRVASIVSIIIKQLNENPELQETLIGAWEKISSSILGIMESIANVLTQFIMPVIGGFFELIIPIITTIVDGLSSILENLRSIGLLEPIIWAIVSALFAWKAATIAQTIANWLLNASLLTKIGLLTMGAGLLIGVASLSASADMASQANAVKEVPMYEDGHFGIDRGQMFIANENGAEMIGTIKGKTSVANNMQIVDGISQGVREAMADVFRSNGGQTVTVKIDFNSNEAARILKPKIQYETNRTGGR